MNNSARETLLTRREALGALTASASIALAGCQTPAKPEAPDGAAGDASANTRTVRILCTSDLHGKMLPWNYPADEEDASGSMPQLATAIASLRDERTLLIDVGDTIQDNMAEVFVEDEVHPMIGCLNQLQYDIGVTGNHEYNYGMDVVRRAIAAFQGTVLTGNVVDEHGNAIAEGYTIIPVDGVRVGIIGMVTPNIVHWDKDFLKDCTVTNPIDETRKIIDKIKDDVDVLVAAVHMHFRDEFDTPGSGVRSYVEACPELDVVLAGHGHVLVEGETVGNALAVENRYQAQTMCVVDLAFEAAGDAWKLTDKTSYAVDVSEYEPDPALEEFLEPYDERAKAYAHEVVGKLEGGPLAPEDEILGVPATAIQDTALVDLINTVQLHYSGADVSVAGPLMIGSNVQPGDIRRCDVSKVYRFNNTLYTVKMTGAQLRKLLEWSAGMIRQWQPGDLTIAFEDAGRIYFMNAAMGMTYKLDISKEAGSRIVDLAWLDGRPVADDEAFVVAVNNYSVTTYLQEYGSVFEEGDEFPQVLDVDIRGDIGGVRELLVDYIQNVRGGTITPECDNSWQLVGTNWDPELHAKAVELVREGKISVEDDSGDNMRRLCTKLVTEADLATA